MTGQPYGETLADRDWERREDQFMVALFLGTGLVLVLTGAYFVAGDLFYRWRWEIAMATRVSERLGNQPGDPIRFVTSTGDETYATFPAGSSVPPYVERFVIRYDPKNPTAVRADVLPTDRVIHTALVALGLIHLGLGPLYWKVSQRWPNPRIV